MFGYFIQHCLILYSVCRYQDNPWMFFFFWFFFCDGCLLVYHFPGPSYYLASQHFLHILTLLSSEWPYNFEIHLFHAEDKWGTQTQHLNPVQKFSNAASIASLYSCPWHHVIVKCPFVLFSYYFYYGFFFWLLNDSEHIWSYSTCAKL